MAPISAAPRVALSNARAEASRINGAKSRGPKTPQGKQRSAQNALKHGLPAQKFIVVDGEDQAAFDALHAALIDELAPEGALQTLLASRIARAAWRLERAERIEGELFGYHGDDGNLGLALVRDGNSTGAFDTLLRYRGSALAELWRALRLLKALQAPAPHDAAAPRAVPERPVAEIRNEPNDRANRGEIVPPPARNEPGAAALRPAGSSRTRNKARVPSGRRGRPGNRGPRPG
jgi:hypothetical protein